MTNHLVKRLWTCYEKLDQYGPVSNLKTSSINIQYYFSVYSYYIYISRYVHLYQNITNKCYIGPIKCKVEQHGCFWSDSYSRLSNQSVCTYIIIKKRKLELSIFIKLFPPPTNMNRVLLINNRSKLSLIKSRLMHRRRAAKNTTTTELN